jgi:uncharacterized membrane protein
MKKTAILPIITVLALAYGTFTGYKVSNDIVNQIADIAAVVITAGISVWGIVKDHSKGEGK